MDRKCACRGVNLLRDMNIAYDLQFDRDPTYKKLMVNIASALYNHIRSQAEKSENKALLAVAQPRLEEQCFLLGSKDFASDPIWAMEKVRDDIHTEDALKHLVICAGSELSQEEEEAIKLVKQAFEILADPESKGYTGADANQPLDDLIKQLSC